MKVMLTGGSGFIGRNILPILKERYDVVAPNRSALSLNNADEVCVYLMKHHFDAVVHCANPNAVKNPVDLRECAVEDSLRLFLNLYSARDCYGKLLYIGSGAEYDKSRDISFVREEEFGRSVPKDGYGLAKYIMNDLAQHGGNVYDLCVFACYGPGDHSSKFITHCIHSCLRNQAVTIRQDCWFDYLHVEDLGHAIAWFVENKPAHTMYNMSSGRRILLSQIAAEVCRQMGNTQPIQILQPALNLEYTADNSRFTRESGITPRISLEQGIAMQIAWEKQNWLEL